MSTRLVFVPIFGDTTSDHEDAWLEAPHVKAWGFLSDSLGPNGGAFVPIYTDPPCTAIELNKETLLFESEGEAAVDVDAAGDLPDPVLIALATMALRPVSPANSND